MDPEEGSPVQVTDMGTTYEYDEYSIKRERLNLEYDRKWSAAGPIDIWDDDGEIFKLEVSGTKEELPWVHALEVDVRVSYPDGTIVEFSGEPVTTHKTFTHPTKGIVLDVEVGSVEWTVIDES